MREPVCPALVGRQEVAELLGMKSSNLHRVALPKPLQERRIRGFKVGATPLYLRAEVEAVVRERKRLAREQARAQARSTRASRAKG